MPDGSPPSVFPSFIYKDAPAAIEWLVRVLRFEIQQVVDAPDGGIAHAELRLGNGIVMLGSERPPEEGVPRPTPGNGATYIALEDVDALHDHAKREGADIAMELRNTDYGSRDFAARDPEGNLWYFGTYNPFEEA